MMSSRLDIPWYEWLYKISDSWDVITLPKKSGSVMRKEKLLKIHVNKYWYWRVTLYKDNKWKHYSVHSLVLLSFIWERNWRIINHIDWNRLNNNINNLEYCTYSYNNWHTSNILWKKPKNIIVWKGKMCHNSRQIFVYKEWEFLWEYRWTWEIARKFNLNSSSVCRSMHKWKHLYWYRFVIWDEKWESKIVFCSNWDKN